MPGSAPPGSTSVYARVSATANRMMTSTSLSTVTPSTVIDTGPWDRVSVITAIATDGLLATAMEANTIATANTTFQG